MKQNIEHTLNTKNTLYLAINMQPMKTMLWEFHITVVEN